MTLIDRGVNTFSPEGRLFQGMLHVLQYTDLFVMVDYKVEYAIEAIKARAST